MSRSWTRSFISLRFIQDDKGLSLAEVVKAGNFVVAECGMGEMKTYYVYIMTNKSGTLYTGMTNNIRRRVQQHKDKLVVGFTCKYNITRLIYHECFTDVHAAITREKEIKGWVRQKKLDLIASTNPQWDDLSDEWFQ